MSSRTALFVFPHDRMGGAERVTAMVAYAAACSGDYDEVVCLVLSRADHGGLAWLRRFESVRLIYTGKSRMILALPALIRFCWRGSYDFVFASFADINAILCLLRRLGILRTRRLVTRESTMFFDRDFGWKNRLVRSLFTLYGRQDLIVCQTDRMARSLATGTSGRLVGLTRVIPNPLCGECGLDESQTEETQVAIPTGVPVIVWCGRLHAVKAPVRAIEVLAALRQECYVNAMLLMIGDGPLKADVVAAIRRLGLESAVILAGAVDRPIPLMRQCVAGLVTSDVEGFPNVILEMLHAGVKGVVSTDCAGGLGDIPSVVVSGTQMPEALAAGLRTVLLRESKDHRVAAFLDARSPAAFYNQLLA